LSSEEFGEELLDDNMIFLQKLSQLIERSLESFNEQRKKNITVALSISITLAEKFKTVIFDRWLSRDALRIWIVPCIKLREEEEISFYAICLTNIILDSTVNEPNFAGLDSSLSEYLLSLTVDIEYDQDQHNLFLESMKLLAGIYDVLDKGINNPVIYQIHNHDNAMEFGQNFIKLMNRGMDLRTVERTMKLLRDIFRDKSFAERFFYYNDLKVLIDVLMRDFDNFDEGEENDHMRRLCLGVLSSVITNSEYSSQEVKYKPTEIYHFLQEIISSELSPTVTWYASQVLEECEVILTQ